MSAHPIQSPGDLILPGCGGQSVVRYDPVVLSFLVLSIRHSKLININRVSKIVPRKIEMHANFSARAPRPGARWRAPGARLKVNGH